MIFTARVIAVPDEHGYTFYSLKVGLAIGAGIALALGTVWTWRRTGGRPAQRRAMQVWHSGALPTR